ncbi:hypothetical protein KUTeg_007074 [Tegillarca granosa]|uniref:Endonuclease/exonuclease/phosphatase domain-containing protein n=1 Tax=Tegillarca granosa TaxID=220873 RepID=A0ABQ9FC70_TEGGR|nr:hypothetical protein KUTeg_007074 [Tegillarca granosa]
MIKIMTMNVGCVGAQRVKGSAKKRKDMIDKVVKIEKPHLVLFQEFEWKKLWLGDHWENYELCENEKKDANILYDKHKIVVKPVSEKLLRSILDEHFSTDFTPMPKLCIRVVKSIGYPTVKFIAVSWHGEYKTSENKRLETFQQLLRFLELVSNKKKKLPLLIGGDFNINIDRIQECVIHPFKLHDYIPTARRESNIIDFFITKNITVENVQTVNLNNYAEEEEPYNLLDHDPKVCIYNPCKIFIYDIPVHIIGTFVDVEIEILVCRSFTFS